MSVGIWVERARRGGSGLGGMACFRQACGGAQPLNPSVTAGGGLRSALRLNARQVADRGRDRSGRGVLRARTRVCRAAERISDAPRLIIRSRMCPTLRSTGTWPPCLLRLVQLACGSIASALCCLAATASGNAVPKRRTRGLAARRSNGSWPEPKIISAIDKGPQSRASDQIIL